MLAVALLILILVAPLILVGMYALPVLAMLALALVAIIQVAVEKIGQGLDNAAIERKVEAGMTPEEARAAVEREQYERAHTSPSLAKVALVSAAFLLVIALAGVVCYLFDSHPEPSSTASTEVKPMIPEVGMAKDELGNTTLGDCTRVELADSAIGPNGAVLEVDYAYVWEASNGSHDPMLKVYVRDGVAVAVERCNVDVYWSDFGSYPNRFADRPAGYVPDGVAGQGAPAASGTQGGADEAGAEPADADEPSNDGRQASDTGGDTTATDATKAPADTYEGNPSAAFDPLDYDSAEEYADDAEGWFRDHGSADPYGDALEYWEDNGP